MTQTSPIPTAGSKLLAFFFIMLSLRAGAQTNTEVYGQNRVQYRKFDWKFFDTRHFRVYHYDRSGLALARYVGEEAERNYAAIERRIGGQFPKKFNLILYNNYDEYRQTNIGLKFDAQIGEIPTGKVDLVGDRLVIYFDGVHTNLKRQIRAGMARSLMERMMFGDNVREILKNNLFLNLPRWITDGYVAYIVDGWDPKSESEWKNLLDAHPGEGFFVLADKQPGLAGKAFWKFIADRYGEQSIRTILNNIQMKSSLNQGIKLSMGMNVRRAYDTCIAFYREAFARDAQQQETPNIDSALISVPIPKNGAVIRSMKVSPKGRDVAYAEFKDGEYRVYIQHTSDQQNRSLILSEGRRDFNEQTPDPDYPILAWSNNGYKLAILFRRGRQTRLRIYSSLKARIENYVIPANRFDRVLGMTFNEDNDQIIFSAIKKSQTDLYAFTIRGSRMTNITNDIWDDIQPAFISGGSRRGILFLSNRPRPNLQVPVAVNELPTGPMNVYFYDTKTLSPELLQCSDNKGGNLTQPIQYGPDNFAYLMDTNGIQNKYVVVFGRNTENGDSAISVPVTNYSRSILNHQYNPAANQVADVLQMGDAYKVFFGPVLIPGENVQPKTLTPTTLSRSAGTGNFLPTRFPERREPDDEQPLIKSGNVFQSEFPDTDTARRPRAAAPRDGPVVRQAGAAPAADTELLDVANRDSTYLKMKARPYKLSFKPDFFSVRLDNTVLFTKYQSTGFSSNPTPAPPQIGGLLSVSLNDAMENHRFSGGVRLPRNFSGLSGMAWFLQYQNFTRRVDWGAVFFRNTNYYTYLVNYIDPATGQSLIQEEQLGKVTTNLLQGTAAYPLDRVRRIDMNLGFRQDVLDFKAEDTLSLTFSPRRKTYWTMSRVEYVFDNSMSPAMNIRFGFRYKVFGEYFYGLSDSKGFYNIGTDFRWYKKLYKNSIFAIRLAGAHSAGDGHILYSLGGVDNWLWPKVSPRPASPGQNYAFLAMSTNLRGYRLQARAGNTYALTNLEVRLPLLTTILERPIQSSFLRNLQLIGFADMGSAWNGLLPNADNTDLWLPNAPQPGAPLPPVTVQLKGGNAFALGYGAGLRSTLLGYFMRLDAAWNIEGLRKPIWYFSLGTDF